MTEARLKLHGLCGDPVAGHAAITANCGPARMRAAAQSKFDLQRLQQLINQREFTVHPVTTSQPKSGFSASLHPDRGGVGAVHHLSEITPDLLAAHRQAAGHPLADDPHVQQVAWHDTKSGNVYVDSTLIHPDEQKVRDFGIAHKQLGYHDLQHGYSVYFDPTRDDDFHAGKDAAVMKYGAVVGEFREITPVGYHAYEHEYEPHPYAARKAESAASDVRMARANMRIDTLYPVQGAPRDFSTIPYMRNNAGMRHVDGYGPDVEPWGRYMYYRLTPDAPEGWESGVVRFARAFHANHNGGRWKHTLSEQYGGATGQQLSARLLAAGYDAVITIDDQKVGEMVDIRPRGQREHRVTVGTAGTDDGHDHTVEREHRGPGGHLTSDDKTVVRAVDLHGAHDVDRMFNGNPTTPVPFPAAGRSKSRRDYDPDLVHRAVHGSDRQIEDVDPRTLRRMQPAVTRAGVEYYLQDGYHLHGMPFADQHQLANQHPVIYRRDDGQNLVLGGHHRAAAALLQGRLLRALIVDGPWGPARTGE